MNQELDRLLVTLTSCVPFLFIQAKYNASARLRDKLHDGNDSGQKQIVANIPVRYKPRALYCFEGKRNMAVALRF